MTTAIESIIHEMTNTYTDTSLSKIRSLAHKLLDAIDEVEKEQNDSWHDDLDDDIFEDDDTEEYVYDKDDTSNEISDTLEDLESSIDDNDLDGIVDYVNKLLDLYDETEESYEVADNLKNYLNENINELEMHDTLLNRSKKDYTTLYSLHSA